MFANFIGESKTFLDVKDFINLEFVDLMSIEAINIMKKYHVHDKSIWLRFEPSKSD